MDRFYNLISAGNMRHNDFYDNMQRLESTIVVIIGLILHLCHLSIIDVGYITKPAYAPSVTSVVVLLSILCILAKSRPLLPSGLRQLPKHFQCILESLVILYGADFLLRQVWVPIVRLLNYACHFASQLFKSNKNEFIYGESDPISKWIQHEFSYILRFLLALLIFYYMLASTGMIKYLPEVAQHKSQFPVPVLKSKAFVMETPKAPFQSQLQRTRSCSCVRFRTFNPSDLPNVPQQDLLNLGNFTAVPRRRSARRRSRPHARDITKQPSECLC